MHVAHDEDAHRFFITTEAGDAVLEYVVTDGRAVFTHTFVPPALRGLGVAEKLVHAGFAWAATNELKIAATCSYVVRFLERHPRS